MLKSYKDLRRWYPPLEPRGVATGSSARPAPPVQPAFADDGAARFPHYIRDTEPEPFDIAFVDEPATRRAEFTGGWTDWVGDHAPGPDDDYEPVHDGEVVHFPWDDEDEPEPERIRSRPRRRVGRDGPGAAAASPSSLRARPSKLRIVLVLAIAVLLLAAAGGFAFYLLRGGDTKRQGAAGPALTMQLSAVTSQHGGCPTEQSEGVLRGAEPGGTDSGPAAIMWFQHSYYVEHSGERAWQVVAPGAAVAPPALIQRGIDSVPPGTDYCVRVVTQMEGKYSVEVTERRPGGVPTTYDKQTVTTAVADGRTLITSIAAG